VKVSLTGLSHRTAPISLRERFALPEEALPAALRALAERWGGAAAVLTTCNRTEVYLAAPEAAPRAAEPLQVIAALRGFPLPEGEGYYYTHSGREAAAHLFRVAAGIESLVIGESEILGQVRAAFSVATGAGTSNHVLARLFHMAIRVGRRARSETAIGRHGVSVSSAAVSLSRRALGDLRGRTVLVLGAGEAGRLVALSLLQQGAGRILVSTRTHARAQEIAGELRALDVPFEDRYAALREADIVIACTSAPEHVITAGELRSALPSRPGRPLVFVDIAVPRDIDPAVRDVTGVSLFDIDDLQSTAEANLELRRAEVGAVERIVQQESRRFSTWLAGLTAVPTVAAIRGAAEAARRAELERTLDRLGPLSDADRRRIEAMSKSIVKRVLHGPLTRLRRDDVTQRHIEAARDLFGLDRDSSP
jgi:glutamyl-tRNA reductase